MKKAHWRPVIMAMRRKGLGDDSMGGRRVEMRVARKRPTDMPWCGGWSWSSPAPAPLAAPLAMPSAAALSLSASAISSEHRCVWESPVYGVVLAHTMYVFKSSELDWEASAGTV